MLPLNVLVVVLDDVGIDQVSPYGFPSSPPTPTLQALADEGLRFDQAWATPLCSPTRAALLTGRFADKTTVGMVISGRDLKELPETEVTLPEMLDTSGEDWSSAAVGKWHVASRGTVSGMRHPWVAGFDHFAGSIGNLNGESFDAWTRLGFDGVLTPVRTFSTTQIVDDAIEALGELEEPFLLYVAFHAAHSPWTAPPPELTPGFRYDPEDVRDVYAANVVAADHELGRLLEALGEVRERTLVVVIGDNGTPRQIKRPVGLEGAKGTFYEGGLRVPLIVSGPAVTARGSTQALVSVVDLFPTLAELAGAEVEVDLDGISLVPVLGDPSAPAHTVLYSEMRFPADGPPWQGVSRAARDASLKVVDRDGARRWFRLEGFDEVPVPRRRFTPEEERRATAIEAELERHGR